MPPVPVEPFVLAVLVLGGFLGGIANGLVGFGSAIVAMVIWLLVIEPLVAVPVMTLCAIAAQLMSLATVWHARNWRRIALLLASSIPAVPVGAWLLTKVDASAFKLFLGLALAIYSGWLLAGRWRGSQLRWRPGAVGTGGIGLLAGFLGGFTGIMAPVLTLWSGLQGWSKDEQRATYQPVMLALVFAMIASYAWQGLVTAHVGWLALYCTPAILLGTLVGTAVYRRISDVQFDVIILVIVFLIGLNLALRAAWT